MSQCFKTKTMPDNTWAWAHPALAIARPSCHDVRQARVVTGISEEVNGRLILRNLEGLDILTDATSTQNPSLSAFFNSSQLQATAFPGTNKYQQDYRHNIIARICKNHVSIPVLFPSFSHPFPLQPGIKVNLRAPVLTSFDEEEIIQQPWKKSRLLRRATPAQRKQQPWVSEMGNFPINPIYIHAITHTHIYI